MDPLMVLLVLALPSFPADGEPPKPPQMECVQSHSEVRPNYPGYNHVVVLANRCDATFRCVITTDVAPQPVSADVPAHATTEVVTFQSSPANTFTYKASCSPKPN